MSYANQHSENETKYIWSIMLKKCDTARTQNFRHIPVQFNVKSPSLAKINSSLFCIQRFKMSWHTNCFTKPYNDGEGGWISIWWTQGIWKCTWFTTQPHEKHNNWGIIWHTDEWYRSPCSELVGCYDQQPGWAYRWKVVVVRCQLLGTFLIGAGSSPWPRLISNETVEHDEYWVSQVLMGFNMAVQCMIVAQCEISSYCRMMGGCG